MTRRTASHLHFKPSGARDLVLVSVERQKRLLGAALAECQAALEELETLRSQWAAYEERDQPAYVAWLWSAFGGTLQEMRELYRQIDEKSSIMDAVEGVAVDLDVSVAEAYAIYLERRKELEAELKAQRERQERAEREKEKAEREKHGPGAKQGSFDWETGGFGFGSDEGGDEDAGSGKRGGPRRGGHGALPGEEDVGSVGAGKARKDLPPEFKSLYRALARQLHPDVSELGLPDRARANQLWHQVQEAYEAGDLQRLRALAAVAGSLAGVGQAGSEPEAGAGRGLPAARISEVIALSRRYRKAARSLEREIHGARRDDPAFGFASAKKTPAVKKQAQRQLQLERQQAQARLDALERELEEWAFGAERVRRGWERAGRSGGRGRGGNRGNRGAGRGGANGGNKKSRSRR